MVIAGIQGVFKTMKQIKSWNKKAWRAKPLKKELRLKPIQHHLNKEVASKALTKKEVEINAF